MSETRRPYQLSPPWKTDAEKFFFSLLSLVACEVVYEYYLTLNAVVLALRLTQLVGHVVKHVDSM